MLNILLVAGLALAQAPTLEVVTSGEAAIACPVVESGAGGETSAACDDTPARIVVTNGTPAARSVARAEGAPRVAPAPRVRLETLAIYAGDGRQPITVSLDTTPDRAFDDMQTLRAVAAQLEARNTTWRYAGE